MLHPYTEIALFVPSYGGDFSTLLEIADATAAELKLAPAFIVKDDSTLPADMVRILENRDYAIHRATAFYDKKPLLRFFALLKWRRWHRSAAHRCLDRVAPTVIVCTGNAFGERLIDAANSMRIPSLYIQWTDMFDRDSFYESVRIERLRKYESLSFSKRMRRSIVDRIGSMCGQGRTWPLETPTTRLAVIGIRAQEMCKKAGISSERVVITGSIQCDRMHQCRAMSDVELCDVRRNLGLRANQPFILYAREAGRARRMHISASSAEFTTTHILRACREAAPGFARVVKLHPREDLRTVNQIRTADPDAVVVVGYSDIGPLVAASKLVISSISTSMLWAVGIDRPAISVYFWENADEMKAARHWTGVDKVDDPSRLQEAIRLHLSDARTRELWRERRRQCREYCLTSDGLAKRRIVQLLASLLRRERQYPEAEKGRQNKESKTI